MIRCYIEKKSRRWDKDIPLLSMALHSMVNRQTGYTPNKLMLGRETGHGVPRTPFSYSGYDAVEDGCQ
jgi:hypothetical protein